MWDEYHSRTDSFSDADVQIKKPVGRWLYLWEEMIIEEM
jgi:hypothetical protein